MARHSKEYIESKKAEQEYSCSAADTIQEETSFPETDFFDGLSERVPFSSTEPEVFDQAPTNRRGLKIFGIVMGALVALLLVVYLAGVAFFSGHFLPGVKIVGQDVSFQSTEEVQSQVASSLTDYTLTISGDGINLTIAGKDISYALEKGQNLLASFNPWQWPVDLISGSYTDPDIAVAYDALAVTSRVSDAVSAFNATATPSTNSELSYDSASNQIVATAETYGTKLDVSAVELGVADALAKIQDSLVLDQSYIEGPTIKASDTAMQNAVSQANSLSQVNVTLTLGGYDAVKVTRANLLEWIKLDENLNVTLDQDAVKTWAENVANKLDTYGKEHTYTRPDGKVVTVEGGEYGWEIDTDSLTQTIVDAVNNGTQGTIEIPCTETADYYDINSGVEWKRWIDVDLEEQHAYFYDNGNLIWESDIISGNINIATRVTPTGVYSIQRKATNETLRTYNEGATEPSICVVEYWMPFIGNTYALHDAWWQPDFGGTMYKDGYGSHGCVNLPSDKAAELYGLCEVGDVVVVHW